MKTYFLLVCASALMAGGIAKAGIIDVVDIGEGKTAQDLASALAGPGVTVLEGATLVQVVDPTPDLHWDTVTYGTDSPNTAAGTFSGSNTAYKVNSGIILSTGRADNIRGTAHADGFPGNFNAKSSISGQLQLEGDPLLEALYGAEEEGMPNQPFGDATRLTFDIDTDANFVTLEFVFASEEYNAYVGSRYNDVFGIFVNDDPTNHAIAGVVNPPVSVNTLNYKSNSQYFVNNDRFGLPSRGTASHETEANGFTSVLTCLIPVDPSRASNTIHLVIADRSDLIRDSWALIRGGSLRATPPVMITKAADSPSTLVSGINGYTLTLSNTGNSNVTVTSIEDYLPDGFTYRSGTTAGVTTSNPSDVTESYYDGYDTFVHHRLTWTKAGGFLIPANSSISLSFDVNVSGSSGIRYNNANASADGNADGINDVPVIPSYDAAPIWVRDPVDIGVTDPDGFDLPDAGTPLDAYDFGAWLTGSSQIAKTFIVRNDGLTTDLTVSSIVVDGVNASDFTLAIPPPWTLPASIPAGGGMPFTLRFKPGANGDRVADISIESSDGDESPFNIYLKGKGVSSLSGSQKHYIKASNPAATDRFGRTVAISGDTIVVGTTQEDSNAIGVNGNQMNNTATDSGAVYVFVRDPVTSAMRQEAYVKASNTNGGDNFGCSVAISGDTMVVGALGEDSNATSINPPLTGYNGSQANNSSSGSGAAYVFVRDPATGVWTQQAYLKGSSLHAAAGFGMSVDIDGDTVVVGAGTQGPGGVVYVFTRSGTTWTQQAIVEQGPSPGGPYYYGLFGGKLALHGNTLVVASPNRTSDKGAADVFVRNGSTWAHQAFLSSPHLEPDDYFGGSVDVWEDTIVIGAQGSKSNANTVNGDESNNDLSQAGAVYVFTRSSGIWSQSAFLKPTNPEENDVFGSSVSISGDLVLACSSFEDTPGNGVFAGSATGTSTVRSGTIYVFRRSGATWNQAGYIKTSNADLNDSPAAIMIEGNKVVVGALHEDSSASGVNGNQSDNSMNESGAVYYFELFK